MKSYLAWIGVTIVFLLIKYQYVVNTYSAVLNDTELADSYAIITGSSSGIGAEMAYQFCKAKANVIIAGTNKEKLQKVEDKCRTLGAKSINSIAISLESLSNCNDFVDKALSILQSTHNDNKIELDYLILNHAIIPAIDLFMQPNATYNRNDLNGVLKESEFSFHVNAMSYVNIATLFYKYLEQNDGRIVISNSAAGKISLPKVAVYGSSKFALNGFFEAWRKEITANLNSNVSITICIIGLIDTAKARKNIAASNVRFPPLLHLLVQEFANVTITARDIIGGAQKRLETVYTPFSDISINMALNHYVPALTDLIIKYVYFGQ